MAQFINGEGAVLEFDDQLFQVSTEASTRDQRRRGGPKSLDEAPEPLEGETETGPQAGAAQWLAGRLAARGVVARTGAPFVIGPGRGAPRPGARAPAPNQASRLTVPLAAGEQAVVLIEGDGVLAWRFGRPAEIERVTALKRARPGVERALIFDLDFPPMEAVPPEAGLKRSWVIDKLIEGARAIVMYFAAEHAAAGVVHLLERKRRTGPVIVRSATDLERWEAADDLRALALPADRPARVLLLVHGTFSSTVGAFGELAATPWGQRLLTTALGRYDAVIGFDHRSLARSPLENAEELLAALRTLPARQPIEFDAVCHSRGGLVLRSLTERLLPGAGFPAKVRRAVFVAATNRGTELARPENWESMIDLVTNLAALTNKVLGWFPATAAAARIADEAIEWIGDFVRYLVEVAVAERKVPGLAAMDPGGPFVREINLTQPGQPQAHEVDCYAIVSDFYAKLLDSGEHEPKEMPRRLAVILADGLVDRLMRGESGKAIANDLVVDVASMTAIDAAAGGFVKDVLDFGRNPLVYHTNYFLRPEVAQRVALWLRLPSPVEDMDPARLVGVRGGLARATASSTVGEVRELLKREQPEYLVLSRQDPGTRKRRLLYYAVRPDEFSSFTAGANGNERVEDAFDLHETDQSEQFGLQQVPFDAGSLGSHAQYSHPRPHARRGVVLQQGAPVSVLEQASNAAGLQALAALAHELAAAPQQAAEPRRRGRPDGERGGAGGPLDDVLELAPPAPVAVHAAADMPRDVKVRSEAVVTVTLSAESIEIAAGPTTAQGEFTASPGETLTVHVIPRRGFDYAEHDATQGRAEVQLPEAGKPRELDFVLVATDAGPGEVTVAIRQGAERRLTLTLRPEVMSRGKPGRASVSAGAGLPEGAQCGPCASLEIFDSRSKGKMGFTYRLDASGVHDVFRAAPIKTDIRAYVEARYKEIENAWLGNERAIDRFAVRLESVGGTMFRKLFPPALQKALWQQVEQGTLSSILVHSDEPFLPWEIVFIDDPEAPAATGRGRFFGELGLCRWLYGTEPVCSIEVRRNGARYVIPHYPQQSWRLPDSEQVEEPMLQRELGATAVTPRHDELLKLLSQPGGFDLLHFAGHATADLTEGEADTASLWLQGEIVDQGGQRSWAKEALTAGTVEQRAQLRHPDGRRPLVVINACQAGRVGYSLTGLGGFATAFLGAREGTGDSRGRAGAFIGALWSVGDKPSSAFVAALYQSLKAGNTMADAVTDARKATRDAGEGSWLAYTVYAHPNLKVTFL